MSTLRSSSKGYVFTFEAALALLLVIGFIGMAVIYSVERQSFVSMLESRELLGDIRRTLDENGFILTVLDNNSFNSDEKMNSIYGTVRAFVPDNQGVRIEMLRYDSNKEACLASSSFEECFDEADIFNAQGEPLPSGKEAVSEKFFLVRKQAPGDCELLGEIELSEENSPDEFTAFFSDIAFFAESDLNIVFGTSVTPEDEVECDETIRVDLNATVPAGGRQPGDVMLSLATSGSTQSTTVVDFGIIAGGSFNEGTCNSAVCQAAGDCKDFTGWQKLSEIEVDFLAQEMTVEMWYDGYSGVCNSPKDSPRLKLLKPDGSVAGESTANKAGDPASIKSSGSPNLAIGSWEVWGWSDGLVDYNINLVYKAKDLEFEKKVTMNFIDLQLWDENLDQLGLYSYASQPSYDVNLSKATDENKTLIKQKISALSQASNSQLLPAVAADRIELTESERARPEAMKFIVILADDVTGLGGSQADLEQEIQLCKDGEVIVYTILFGSKTTLEPALSQLANETGGKYYYVNSFTLLNAAYDEIADQIGSLLQANDRAYNASLSVELPYGVVPIDLSNGIFSEGIDANFIVFNIGTLLGGDIWADYFTAEIPCNIDASCNTRDLNFPGENTYFNYSNADGDAQAPIQWPERKTIIFKYRDLAVDILSGRLVSANTVALDINAANAGLLDSAATNVKIYWENYAPENLLDTIAVSQMNAGQVTLFYDIEMEKEGIFIAVINEDDSIQECPMHNASRIRCYGGAGVQYYVMNVWTWRK